MAKFENNGYDARVNEILAKLHNPADKEFVESLVTNIEFLRLVIEQQDKRLADYSWERSPDRMGGQFTQDEIDEARRGGHGW
jgi:hypothetical protein